jgi:hypothetical protein
MDNSQAIALVEQHSETHEGFPRPDWKAIAQRIEENFSEPRRHEAWKMNALLTTHVKRRVVRDNALNPLPVKR